jgi:hypothetical protein
MKGSNCRWIVRGSQASRLARPAAFSTACVRASVWEARLGEGGAQLAQVGHGAPSRRYCPSQVVVRELPAQRMHQKS